MNLNQLLSVKELSGRWTRKSLTKIIIGGESRFLLCNVWGISKYSTYVWKGKLLLADTCAQNRIRRCEVMAPELQDRISDLLNWQICHVVTSLLSAWLVKNTHTHTCTLCYRPYCETSEALVGTKLKYLVLKYFMPRKLNKNGWKPEINRN